MKSTTGPALKLANLPIDILNHILAYLNYQDIYKLCLVNFRAECGLNGPELDMPADMSAFLTEFIMHIRSFLRAISGVSKTAPINIPFDEERYKARLYAIENNISYSRTLLSSKNQSTIRTYFHEQGTSFKGLFNNKYKSHTPEYTYVELVTFTLDYFTKDDCAYERVEIRDSRFVIYKYYLRLFTEIKHHRCEDINLDAYLPEFSTILDSIYLLWKHVDKIQLITNPYILFNPYVSNPEDNNIVDLKDKYHVIYKVDKLFVNNAFPCIIQGYINNNYNSNTNPAIKEYNRRIQEYVTKKHKELNLHLYYNSKKEHQFTNEEKAYDRIAKKYTLLYTYRDVVKHIKNLIESLNKTTAKELTEDNLKVRVNKYCYKHIIDDNIKRETIIRDIFGDMDIASQHISKKERLIYLVVKAHLLESVGKCSTVIKEKISELSGPPFEDDEE